VWVVDEKYWGQLKLGEKIGRSESWFIRKIKEVAAEGCLKNRIGFSECQCGSAYSLEPFKGCLEWPIWHETKIGAKKEIIRRSG
jgi:hypothetical protein